MSVEQKVIAWFATGHVGESSKCMAAHLTGQDCKGSYPHDGDDFGRCVGLLDAVPELRERLPQMASVNAKWAALVARWDEIESLHKKSKGDVYVLMKSILRPIEDGDPNIIRLGTGATLRFGGRDRV